MIDPKLMLEFIKQRRSIRTYQDGAVPDNVIEMILEAGRWAPSASNKQPWHFIVIKNKELLEKLSKLTTYSKFIKRAPVAVAIVGKMEENPNWYVQDTSLASMNMQLMAWSLGVGTCWVGSMDREKAKKLLNLGEGDFLLTVLPMGYIKGSIPKPTLRKPLDEITSEIK
ncbi:MAG: hypothetical protein EU544_04555 [Promethearchaeota archaeon]|nr:MAG: hypothetical protein EU544_04555 [Candidatus Lokiarchaeota archaeon]